MHRVNLRQFQPQLKILRLRLDFLLQPFNRRAEKSLRQQFVNRFRLRCNFRFLRLLPAPIINRTARELDVARGKVRLVFPLAPDFARLCPAAPNLARKAGSASSPRPCPPDFLPATAGAAVPPRRISPAPAAPPPRPAAWAFAYAPVSRREIPACFPASRHPPRRTA